MQYTLPEFAFVLLIGPSAAGKTTFARKHFTESEILSPEKFACLIADGDRSEQVQADAWDLLDQTFEKRMFHRKLTVVDAINLNAQNRAKLRKIAKRHYCPIIGIVFDLPEDTVLAHHAGRQDSPFTPALIQMQLGQMQGLINLLRGEGMKRLLHLQSVAQMDEMELLRKKSLVNYMDRSGPFDLVGDVHGCLPELLQLLGDLGYRISGDFASGFKAEVPKGRTLVFVGDLTDRGPDSPGVLRLVMDLVKAEQALCVPGNHDDKLMRHLKGNKVQLKHGLEVTVAQMEPLPQSFHDEVRDFIETLPMHLLLDAGKLVVAHAGLKESMHGRTSGGVRSFCLYGETTGETDEFGLPVRFNWAAEYTGEARVIYGHTPVPTAEWLNQTMDIDTGCVFGGKLTGLRYPEMSLVEVPAQKEYAKARRPMGLNVPEPEAGDPFDNLMPWNRFSGRNLVLTRLKYNITLKDDLALVNLNHLVEHGANPNWQVYLPHLISVGKSSSQGSYLEHPEEAFSYFRKKAQDEVVVQVQPHGLEVVVVLCKSIAVAKERFGVANGELGCIYGPSGEAVFSDQQTAKSFLHKLVKGLEASDFWENNSTGWLVLEGILQIPERTSASEQLQMDLRDAGLARMEILEKVAEAAKSADSSPTHFAEDLAHFRSEMEAFDEALASKNAFLPGESVFHLRWVVASEDKVHLSQSPYLDQAWLQDWAAQTPSLELCAMRLVNLHNPAETRNATEWWESSWKTGHGGALVFPPERIVEQGNDISQPVLKVRHPEALRLLFGPQYQRPEQLAQLRIRSLKELRQQAVREFALAFESISRFVEQQTLVDVQECINNLLSLKSRERDPRL